MYIYVYIYMYVCEHIYMYVNIYRCVFMSDVCNMYVYIDFGREQSVDGSGLEGKNAFSLVGQCFALVFAAEVGDRYC